MTVHTVYLEDQGIVRPKGMRAALLLVTKRGDDGFRCERWLNNGHRCKNPAIYRLAGENLCTAHWRKEETSSARRTPG